MYTTYATLVYGQTDTHAHIDTGNVSIPQAYRELFLLS